MSAAGLVQGRGRKMPPVAGVVGMAVAGLFRASWGRDGDVAGYFGGSFLDPVLWVDAGLGLKRGGVLAGLTRSNCRHRGRVARWRDCARG